MQYRAVLCSGLFGYPRTRPVGSNQSELDPKPPDNLTQLQDWTENRQKILVSSRTEVRSGKLFDPFKQWYRAVQYSEAQCGDTHCSKKFDSFDSKYSKSSSDLSCLKAVYPVRTPPPQPANPPPVPGD